jgi:hypothetical protein
MNLIQSSAPQRRDDGISSNKVTLTRSLTIPKGPKPFQIAVTSLLDVYRLRDVLFFQKDQGVEFRAYEKMG